MRLTLRENTTYNHNIRPLYRFSRILRAVDQYVATNELKQL